VAEFGVSEGWDCSPDATCSAISRMTEMFDFCARATMALPD